MIGSSNDSTTDPCILIALAAIGVIHRGRVANRRPENSCNSFCRSSNVTIGTIGTPVGNLPSLPSLPSHLPAQPCFYGISVYIAVEDSDPLLSSSLV